MECFVSFYRGHANFLWFFPILVYVLSVSTLTVFNLQPTTWHVFYIQFSSVAQSCLTLGDPMHCSTPGFPVHHQLLELTQTHAHRVGDAIQPSHPLSFPSPHAFNFSQHQGLYDPVNAYIYNWNKILLQYWPQFYALHPTFLCFTSF